jgi:hypothetical protein
VRDRGVERGLRHPDGEGADAGPKEVERVHRDREPAVEIAEHLVRLDADAVEVEAADRVRREQVEALARKTLALAWDVRAKTL